MAPSSPAKESLIAFTLRKHPVEIFIYTIGLIAMEIVALHFFARTFLASNQDEDAAKLELIALILPITFYGAWIHSLYAQREAALLEKFAVDNAFLYDKDGIVDETTGALFHVDGRKQVSDVVSGTLNTIQLRAFLYQVTVGSGKSSHDYQDTVFELDIADELPHLLLISKAPAAKGAPINAGLGTTNTIHLEGDFDTYFTLFAYEGTQIEALEVFAPNTMALLVDQGKSINIELIGKRIYLYIDGFVSSRMQLDQALTLAKSLITELVPLAQRMDLSPSSYAVAADINHSFDPYLKTTAVWFLLAVVLGMFTSMAILVANGSIPI